MYCKHCGKQIADDAKFCDGCGASTQDSQQPVINIITNANPAAATVPGASPKNKWVAFLLCLFLGEFGFHRFYVGKIGTGILWLFTFGLCGIGWLVDLIVILCGNFKDKASLPLI